MLAAMYYDKAYLLFMLYVTPLMGEKKPNANYNAIYLRVSKLLSI